MTGEPVTIPRDDTDAYMLVPLTPFEVVNLMRASGILMETEPDAVLAQAFAYLRDTNAAYLVQNPGELPALHAMIAMLRTDKNEW